MSENLEHEPAVRVVLLHPDDVAGCGELQDVLHLVEVQTDLAVLGLVLLEGALLDLHLDHGDMGGVDCLEGHALGCDCEFDLVYERGDDVHKTLQGVGLEVRTEHQYSLQEWLHLQQR